MDPTRSYWYRCDDRWPMTGWLDFITLEDNCLLQRDYGCEWRSGSDNHDCQPSPTQSDGCCVIKDPTNEGNYQCALIDEYWGKDVCILKGGSYGCEWREGAQKGTLECADNVEIDCNDQYSCTDGASGYQVSCNGDFSCGNMGTDPVVVATTKITCSGHQSCDGASLAASGTIHCSGQWRYAFVW